MSQQPLSYYDPAFLDSADARPLRILAEYLEPLQRFKEQKIQDTVVFFGSARVDSRERAQQALNTLRSRGVHDADEQYQKELRKVHRAVEWARYYEEARELARLLTEWTGSLQSDYHRFVVTSGGGPGIMEAANRGAREAGGKTIGLNIRLPYEQSSNKYISDGLHFEFHYFFMRKFWFAYMAKALVIFPGGFGTCDEFFEVLTLVQTNKLSRRIDIVLYGTEYWEQILNFQPLADWGAINEQDLTLLHHADTPEDAFEHLRDHLIQYHLEPDTPQEPDAAPGLAKTQG